jgi:hypothetical protein
MTFPAFGSLACPTAERRVKLMSDKTEEWHYDFR